VSVQCFWNSILIENVYTVLFSTQFYFYILTVFKGLTCIYAVLNCSCNRQIFRDDNDADTTTALPVLNNLKTTLF